MSRIEKQLQKINGDDVQTEEPQSRIEKQLAYILGADIVLEEPQSRIEELVQQIIDNGGGGGGGGSSSYTITLISAPVPQFPDDPASDKYYINCFDENYVYYGGAVKTNEGYIGEYQTEEVWAGTPQDIEVIIFPSKGISVVDNTGSQPISVTGDAQIVHHEDEGYWAVYVTGNCTITYQGKR